VHKFRTVFKCKLCPATYARKERLKEHAERYRSSGKPNCEVRPDPHATRKRRYGIQSLEVDTASLSDVEDITSTSNQHPIRVQFERIPSFKTEVPSPSESECDSDDSSLDGGASDLSDSDSTLDDTKKSVNAFSASIPVYDRAKIVSDPVVQKLMAENPELVNKTLPFKNSTSDTQYTCKLCGWEGCRFHNLQQHFEKKHGQKLKLDVRLRSSPSPHGPVGIELFCSNCGYQAESAQAITEHMTDAHPVDESRKFPCSYCYVRLATERMKIEHETRVHKTERKFICNECGSKFMTQSRLNWHKKSVHIDVDQEVTNRKQLKCKTCSQVYISKYAYLRHIDRHLSPEKRKFPSSISKCQLCGQTCATPAILKRHIQYVHLRQKNIYNERVRLRRQDQKLSAVKKENEDIHVESLETNTTENIENDVPEQDCKVVAFHDSSEEVLGF
jgi:hypothetical protein